MTIKKEKTKKGVFYFEIGNKLSNQDRNFEDHYNSNLSKKNKWQITWELFLNYHLSHGYKEAELRLDRTVIEFGRRKS